MNRRKIICFFMVAAVLLSVTLPGRVEAASKKAVTRAYNQKIKNLKKSKKYKDGIYTATMKSATGNELLLVTDGAFGKEKFAISADVYQYVGGKVKKLCKVVSTGTAYPLCKKGKYILSGFHHNSFRYQVKNGVVIMEEYDGIYLDSKYCYYKKYCIKDGKKKLVKKKKVKTTVAEKNDFYCNAGGNSQGEPIKFMKQK